MFFCNAFALWSLRFLTSVIVVLSNDLFVLGFCQGSASNISGSTHPLHFPQSSHTIYKCTANFLLPRGAVCVAFGSGNALRPRFNSPFTFLYLFPFKNLSPKERSQRPDKFLPNLYLLHRCPTGAQCLSHSAFSSPWSNTLLPSVGPKIYFAKV